MADNTDQVSNVKLDRSSQLYAAAITTWVIAIVVLSLRIFGRIVSGNRLWWDDRFIIAAMVRASRVLEKRPSM